MKSNINRRDAIKGFGLTAAALVAGTNNLLATPTSYLPGKKFVNSAHFNFEVGNLELMAVSDGHTLFKPAQPIFAPGVPANEVKTALDEYFVPSDSVDVAFNVLVLRIKNEIILIDSGCGPGFGDQAGHLPKNLQAAGITPGQVTAVILTHAHPDHIGGMADANGKKLFPNAGLYISKPEFDFWTSTTPDFSKNKLDDSRKKGFIAIAQRNLEIYSKQVTVFNDGQQLFDYITPNIVPGHTPGHTLLSIISDNQELVHFGDTAHNHILMFTNPNWGVMLDTDPMLAISARKKIFTEHSVKRSRIFAYHLPWPGLGFIRKKGNGYEWISQAFATPG